MSDLEQIKNIISEIFQNNFSRIILFGSRARGDFKEDSDYDFLIVLKVMPEREEYLKHTKSLRQKLADLHYNADLVIRTEQEMQFLANAPGTTSYNAIREGIGI